MIVVITGSCIVHYLEVYLYFMRDITFKCFKKGSSEIYDAVIELSCLAVKSCIFDNIQASLT